MTPKYAQFINNLTTVLGSLETNEVKEAIGDSTNNHRTLTVSQVIRFLESRRNGNMRILGANLAEVYELIREDLIFNRGNNRTDAIDINEFVDGFETFVLGGGRGAASLRQAVGRAIAA